ncbi:GBS Bsp-like repeat-containing protein [Enterococcus cecorum]|uniref:GBS Bsp-like repeat-containing protein n=1 Tax=Enterococcus cecorum TaxID=44008 RepID=UPI001FABC832|nr:GBS Bsp-like repeat-containing protein [Enterococcus cecorum]MCJ0553881.1 GBS Bsp-like repeat-containing protein [Enterococcus cecorum]MCJ0558804.1 GBS Bsp-like repeat-containing protein [Enterococcus cecorum]MCJ0563444.1 GBS Bsp-like repeat-containing protein [Enterococcus cecorum]MCJ0597856.1 GBS Bsp-like repeat-containing protein [Enterococcus cecorum]
MGKVQLEEFQSNVSAKVQNIDTVNGTYDIVIQANSGAGIHHITVPIWSKADKSNLKNYEAVNENGQWVVHFNKQNHQNHIGIYHNVVEAYFNDHTGKRISMENVEIKGEPLTLEGNIVNINSVNGSYDVVIKADAPESVKSVRVPIWTNAKDIKWYQAKQQADGTWTVHMDIKNHNNHLGKYTTHVYMTTNDGRETARNLGQTELKGQPLELTGKIINVNSKAGSYDVVVNASAPSGVKSVRVPIWTNAKDIKWYQAKKQKDGTWTVHMDIKNHSNHLGKYTTHVYMTANDGCETAKNLGQTELKGYPLEIKGDVINLNNNVGTFDVSVRASAPSGVKSVRVPIWTNAKDIKWYQAKKQKDGTWTVHMNIRNHQLHEGKYSIHVYIKENNGVEHAVALSPVSVKATEIKENIAADVQNIDQNSGRFDVFVYTKSENGVKSVQVPVGHNSSDLKWYSATKVGNNVYKATISVKNHHFSSGKYNIHAYLTDNKGKQVSINVGSVNLTGVYNRIKMSNVPWISQYKPVFAPWGCASAAMAMLIESRGIHVDLKYAQDTLPMYPANKDGQKGNVYTGEGFGFVIKPSGLVRHAHKWTNAVYNISGSSTQQIIDTVLNGQPVLYYGFSGYQVDNVRNHCKVIVGYKDGKFKVHDPLYMRASDGPGSRETNKTYSRGAIHWITIAQFNQEYQGNAITIK